MKFASCLNRRWPSHITHAIQPHVEESWAEQCHECLRVRGPPSTFGQRGRSPLCCSAHMRRQPDVYLVLDCTGCAAVPESAVGVPVDMRTLGKPHEQPVACTAPVTAGGFSSSSLSQAYCDMCRCHENSKRKCAPIGLQHLSPNRQGGFSELLEVAPCSDV